MPLVFGTASVPTCWPNGCHRPPSSGPVLRRQWTTLPSRRSTKPRCRPSVRMRRPSFPQPHLIGLLLELGAPRSGFRVLYEYITRRGDAYTARTGLPFPRPIPTRDKFDATWKSLTALLALSPPVECADPPSSGRCWPLRSWAQYVHSRPALCQSIDWTRPLTFVVRGDGYPCAGGSWSQLSVGLLNHGLKARTPAFLWVIGMAVRGDKDMVALGQIWLRCYRFVVCIFVFISCS